MVVSLTERRAIEALRAGVPNRDAVRHLGTTQRAIEKRFLDALSMVAGERRSRRQVPGFLIGGDFGAGKSHLLEWLQHLALEQSFACSRVVISKEAPLGQPHRVFRAAIQSLKLPGLVGGLEELADSLDMGTASYQDMAAAVNDPSSGFDPLFPATLLVHEHASAADPQRSRMVGFWRGERVDLATLRQTLRTLGRPMTVKQRKIADLALPRFRFVAELLAGAGFAGWVILLDELELVAQFSLQSRARSYATLATLAGLAPGEPVPGLLAVGAVTSDLDQVAFTERADHERIPQKLGLRLPQVV